MMIKVKKITAEDDLEQLVDEINHASWDDGNEMTSYDVQSLAGYLRLQDSVFLACHAVQDTDRVLLGIASGRIQIKPYDRQRWLYVDEVDVCADQRRRGAGRALMEKFFEIARSANCEEVWLGTETDNIAANALYGSTNPGDVEQFIGYTWSFNQKNTAGNGNEGN